MMEGRRISDFSVERILSPQLGPRPPRTDRPAPDTCGSARPGPPAPVPVPLPVPGPTCLQYRGLSFVEAFFHPADFYPNPAVCLHFAPERAAEAPQLAGYHGYPQAQPQPPRQKARMRTVFTDSQTKRLEALFHITDYPAAEQRAEAARSSGLSEETVRVWFKNRRARRKRQRSGSKVKSPSPPRSAGAEKKFFTSFL